MTREAGHVVWETEAQAWHGSGALGWHGRHSEKRKHAARARKRMHMHVQHCRRAATLLCSLGSVQVQSLAYQWEFGAEQDEEAYHLVTTTSCY